MYHRSLTRSAEIRSRRCTRQAGNSYVETPEKLNYLEADIRFAENHPRYRR